MAALAEVQHVSRVVPCGDLERGRADLQCAAVSEGIGEIQHQDAE